MAAETASPPAVPTYVNTPAHAQPADASPRFRRYRVRIGMLAWMLHRLSGLAVLFYVTLHIWGLRALADRDAYNHLIAGYHAWYFKIGEFLLWCAVVYHMLNGLRIVLIDFLGWSPRQKRLFWTLGAVAVVMIAAGGYPSLYALYAWLTT